MGPPAPFATSHVIGPEEERTNDKTMRPDTHTKKNNGAAGHLGPVKIGLRKDVDLL